MSSTSESTDLRQAWRNWLPILNRAGLPASTLHHLELTYCRSEQSPYVRLSIEQLIDAEAWDELNLRFFDILSFGTGGMRGRTIGKVIPTVEWGERMHEYRPDFAAVGTRMMNEENVRYAAIALGEHARERSPEKAPRMILSHDYRFFSREFADIVAETWQSLGMEVCRFAEPRSTPHLSFAIRHLQAAGGAMITASHNPPEENGFKAYLEDGGQVVEPHAEAIWGRFESLILGDRKIEPIPGGSIRLLEWDIDQAYLEAVDDLVLEPEVLQNAARKLHVVYTPLYGNGLSMTLAALKAHGTKVSVVEDQARPDPRFGTVASPNPENPVSLSLALAQAERDGADLVIATDPDGDRLGAIARDRENNWHFLTGNQIGAILAYYRADRLFVRGILNSQNRGNAALIKTFVTSDIQREIADYFGVKCVETLTGFKHVAAKLQEYEDGVELGDYPLRPYFLRRAVTLRRSTHVYFANEESHGYSGGDYTHEKDGTAAALMLVEAAAWAQKEGKTLWEYLDVIHEKCGCYFWEKQESIFFSEVDGWNRMQALVNSYRANWPMLDLHAEVERVNDFEQANYDVDGSLVPHQNLLIFYFRNGIRIAVRPSGTEPKLKFYLSIRRPWQSSRAVLMRQVDEELEHLWEKVAADAQRRLEVIEHLPSGLSRTDKEASPSVVR